MEEYKQLFTIFTGYLAPFFEASLIKKAIEYGMGRAEPLRKRIFTIFQEFFLFHPNICQNGKRALRWPYDKISSNEVPRGWRESENISILCKILANICELLKNFRFHQI